MGREVPFDENSKCDECGAVGAFDFMGDLLCHSCADAAINDEPAPSPGDDDDECSGCHELWMAHARIESLQWLVEVQDFCMHRLRNPGGWAPVGCDRGQMPKFWKRRENSNAKLRDSYKDARAHAGVN